jgi:hypothetical protein
MPDQELTPDLREAIQGLLGETAGRRAEDQSKTIGLLAITAYVGLASFVGAIVLWIGDARIAEGIKPISDKQINIDANLDNMKDLIKNTDRRLDRMEKGIDAIRDVLIKK